MTTALVTGASAGIGRSFAQKLAQRGHDLVLVARDETRLKELAGELPTNAEVLPADLSDREDLRRVEARLRDAARPVDVLVNNAGFGTAGPFQTLDVDREDQMIQLNITALMRLTHAALGPMLERGRGGIVNVSSIGGFQPVANNATYSATKAFVTSFTQAIHEEVRGKGVSVVTLTPGFTRTEFQERGGFRQDGPGFLWQSADEVADVALAALDKNKPIAVPGVPNKVAAVAVHLAPRAVVRRIAGMTGERINAD